MNALPTSISLPEEGDFEPFQIAYNRTPVGEEAKGPKPGGIPPRGDKARHPRKKTGAHVRCTKSGQEPTFIENSPKTGQDHNN